MDPYIRKIVMPGFKVNVSLTDGNMDLGKSWASLSTKFGFVFENFFKGAFEEPNYESPWGLKRVDFR